MNQHWICVECEALFAKCKSATPRDVAPAREGLVVPVTIWMKRIKWVEFEWISVIADVVGVCVCVWFWFQSEHLTVTEPSLLFQSCMCALKDEQKKSKLNHPIESKWVLKRRRTCVHMWENTAISWSIKESRARGKNKFILYYAVPSPPIYL